MIPLIDQDRAARRQIRELGRNMTVLLDEHCTTCVTNPARLVLASAGIGPIAAATLLAEAGDPFGVDAPVLLRAVTGGSSWWVVL